MTDEERQQLIAALRSETFTLEMNYQAADELERLAALAQPDAEPPHREPDPTQVICPNCTHQFTAISVADQERLRVQPDAEPVRAFAKAVLHGDDEHKRWLLGAAEAFIAGKSLPAPRGKGTAPPRPDAKPVAGSLDEARTIALEQRCERGTPWDLACVTIANKIGEKCGYPPIPTNTAPPRPDDAEPAAWQYRKPDGKWQMCDAATDIYYRTSKYEIRPLYAAPAAWLPDTDMRVELDRSELVARNLLKELMKQIDCIEAEGNIEWHKRIKLSGELYLPDLAASVLAVLYTAPSRRDASAERSGK